mgnify:CR=1 FL=1
MPIIDSLSEYKPITDASNLEDLQTTPLILDEEENEVEVIWDKQPIVKKNISLVPESKTKGAGLFGVVTPLKLLAGTVNKGLSVGASLSDIISEFDWKSSELNPTKEGLTSKDLYKKENFSVIQNMMKRRYGMDLKYNKAEDIVSSWRQMMKNRDMYHAGNSVTMFNWLTKATDADKKATKDSIELWTEVGGAFQKKERQLFKEENLLENKYVLNEEGQLDWDYYKNKPVSALYPDGSPSRLGYEGEARSLGKQSVIDTAQAVLTDPINIIPIITFGRIKTKQARKLATVFRQKEINHIKNNVLKDKRYKDLKSKKIKIDYEVQKLTWKAMQSADIQFSAMKRALLGSSGINAASNAAIDWLNQTADITVDIKDKDTCKETINETIRLIYKHSGEIFDLEHNINETVIYLKQLRKDKNNIKTVQKAKILLKEPVYLKNKKDLGRYDDLKVDGYNIQYNYNYAISAWFFIRAQPPNYGDQYRKHTTILDYGGKPTISYNGSDNSLKITMNNGLDKKPVIYKITDFPLQRWNNIVINYDSGVLDIFMNSKLVASFKNVVPYMSIDNVSVGDDNGIGGGVCNVLYFPRIMSKERIDANYAILKNINPPII